MPRPARLHSTRLDRRGFLWGAGTVLGAGRLLRAQTSTSPSIDSRHLVTEEAEVAIRRGLEWLASRQLEEGSFGPATAFNRYRRNPAVNGLCGLAFLSEGSTPGRGPWGRVLERCVRFILSCAAPTGFIAEDDTSYYQAPMYGHGFATLFLAEVYGTRPDPALRETLHRAVQLIIDTQNQRGGWRYAPRPDDDDISVTVCEAMALRAAHNAGIAVPRATIDRAVAYIQGCQNPDGGFKYQLLGGGISEFPRSAAALAALYTSGVSEGPVIDAAVRYLTQFRPGEAALRDRGYYFYAHYYAVQAAWHAGGEVWRTWYPAVRDELLRTQLSGGGWTDPGVGGEYATAMALIVLQMPNNFLPIFQR
jgi:hypothetical protein